MENKAKLLHEVLLGLHGSNGHLTIGKALLETFQVQEKSTDNALHSFSSFFQLISEVRRKIERSNNEHKERYLSAITEIETIVSGHSLLDKVSDIKTKINQDIFDKLVFCSDVIYNDEAETSIGEKELSLLMSHLDEFYEKICTTDHIDYELKEFIVNHLDEIRRALVFYRINGLEGLRKAIERAYGALVLNKEIIQDKCNNSQGSKHIKGLFDILSKFNTVVSSGENSALLMAQIFHIIDHTV